MKYNNFELVTYMYGSTKIMAFDFRNECPFAYFVDVVTLYMYDDV